MSWPAWLDTVRSDRDNAISPLLDWFAGMAEIGDDQPVIDTSATARALAGTATVPPPLTSDLLAKYIDFFVATGYFPAPSRSL